MHKSIRQLFDLLAPYERRRLGLLLCMVLLMGLLNTAGVASLLPFLTILANPEFVQENETLRSINEMLGFSEPNELLIFLGIATFILIFFGQIFTALTVYATQRFGMHREFTFGTRLLARYLGQPYAWFLNRNSAELGKSILSEVERVVEGWLIPLVRGVAQGVVVASLILLLLVVQPVAALAMALIVGGSYWLVFWASRRYVSRIGNDRVLANAARFRATQDALRGIKEVKLLGLEDAYVAQFAEPAERNARYRAASNAIYEMPRFLLEAFVFGAMMLLLLGMMVGDRGELDSLLPVIGVFAFAGARLFPAVQRLYADLSRVRYNQPALNNLHAELLDGDSDAAAATARRNEGKLKLVSRLELRDAEYCYQGATASALRGLTLKIEANTTVGLVGSTGAGKTTAVDVILGLLELQKGALVVDGQEIGSANRRAWQRSLGYVPQQNFLIDDTVAANIALGVPHDEIDMDAVERAARLAELHDFIANELPRGYQTVIGDSGARLSGGQRQRICIARALYRDPEVLILDEATSALDNLTERAVMDAVHNLSRQKTIIIIAHRLTTVRSCDQIYLLENGGCSAVGTYDDLVQKNLHFREMVATSNL